MSQIKLNTVVFIGSARNVIPPWGGAKRTGDCILAHLKTILETRIANLGQSSDTVSHNVTYYDPIEVFGEGGALSHSGCEIREPTFFVKPDTLSEQTKAMLQTIKAADAQIILTPEQNHCPPPALLGMLNHFGGSNFKNKPSAIVTYSMGPQGGARAAMPLQFVLHELGCLPVSKMVHLPCVQELIDENGEWKDPEHRMKKELPAVLLQLEWMAVAMKNQRDKYGE